MKLVVLIGLIISFSILIIKFNESFYYYLGQLIIILIFTSIFHQLTFIIDKILKRKKGNETISEHFIWAFLSFLIFIIIDVNFISISFSMNYLLYMLILFIITIEITYIISAINIIYRKPNLFVDIGGYVLALIISNIIISIIYYFSAIIIISLLIIVLLIFLKKRIY